MRYLQRFAAVVFGLTVTALIGFETVKDTHPAGSAVIPILVVILIASALIWLGTEVVLRRRGSGDARPPSTPEPPAMFEIDHLGAGRFRQNRGRMLRAGRVDTLESVDNEGPDGEADEAE